MVKENGQVVLIDFGIARVFPKLSSNHDSRQIEQEISSYVGTLPYMSPEQLSSRKAIDYRTDIYSLGVTLYEMLLGERAFKGTSLSMYRAIQNWYPPEPSSIHKDIPPELDIITMKAMEKDKHRRYRSGAEFAEDLHRWLHGMPILSSRISWWARMWRKFRGWFRWI